MLLFWLDVGENSKKRLLNLEVCCIPKKDRVARHREFIVQQHSFSKWW